MDSINFSSDKFDVNMTEHAGKPGFVYDIDGDFSMENLPNIEQLADKVLEILEYATQPEIKKLRADDINEYTMHMEKRFSKFSDRFFAIFQKIISGENVSPLFYMLDKLQKVQSGKMSIEDAEKDVGMELYNSFVKDTIEKK